MMFTLKHRIAILFSAVLHVAISSNCSDMNDCVECVGGGCAWAVQTCMDSCMMIADTSCYQLKYFPDSTASDICEVEQNNLADVHACDSISPTSCEICVQTILPSSQDGSSTCMWFENEDGSGFCQSSCGMMGCGESLCPNGDNRALYLRT
eukprot:994089_1